MNQGLKVYKKLDEVVSRLREVAHTPDARISDDPALTQAVMALISMHRDVPEKAKKEDILEFINRLEKMGPEKADPILERLFAELEEEEESKEVDLGSKAVDKKLLDELLAELDEHAALKEEGVKKEAERLAKKKGLGNIKKEIEAAIAKQVEEYKAQLERAESEAPLLSKTEKEKLAIKTVETKQRIEEIVQEAERQGRPMPEAKERAEEIAQATVMEVVGKIEEDTDFEQIHKRTTEKTRGLNIKDKVLVKELIAEAEDAAAEIAITRQARKMAENLVEELKASNDGVVAAKVDQRKEEVIEELSHRIEEVLGGKKERVEYVEEIVKSGGIREAGEKLEEKLSTIVFAPETEKENQETGTKDATGDRGTIITGAVIQTSQPETAGKRSRAISQVKIENQTLKKIGSEIEAYIRKEANLVDKYRGVQVQREVIKRGGGMEYARFVRELNYGTDPSLTAAETIAVQNAESLTEYEGWKVKEAKQEYRVIHNLIHSKTPIGDRLRQYKEKFSQIEIPETANGEIRAVGRVMKLLDTHPEIKTVLDSAWRMRQGALKIGSKLAGWEKAGVQWVMKSETVTCMTNGISILAKMGLKEGATEVGVQFITGAIRKAGVQLAKEGIKKVGTKVTTTAAGQALTLAGAKAAAYLGLSGTGVGTAVVAILVGAEEVIKKIKQFAQAAKLALHKVLAPIFGEDWERQLGKLNFLNGIIKDIKSWIPGVTDKIPDWLLATGMGLMSIVGTMMAIPIAATAGTAVMGVFGGLMIYNLLFIEPVISELVPPAPPRGVEIYDYSGPGAPTAVPFDPKDPWKGGTPMPTRDPKIPISPSCPETWPTKSGYITQGPNGSWSHRGTQAIDIGVGSVPILATHNGVARYGQDHAYGHYVDITGTCNGVTFTTRYAHMNERPSMFDGGQQVSVTAGQTIGIVDNTGNSTGSHLHYELRGLGEINKWIPEPVPNGCSSVSQCNTSIP